MICGFIAGLIYDLTSANPIGYGTPACGQFLFHGPKRGKRQDLWQFWYLYRLCCLQAFGVTFMHQLINSLIGSGDNFFEDCCLSLSLPCCSLPFGSASVSMYFLIPQGLHSCFGLELALTADLTRLWRLK